MSPARPGAFNANFAPETLDAFKSLCRSQGLAYTKVLEQFAELYLKSNGNLLQQLSVPSTATAEDSLPASSTLNQRRSTVEDILDRLETVEGNTTEFASAFEILIHRVETLESKLRSKED